MPWVAAHPGANESQYVYPCDLDMYVDPWPAYLGCVTGVGAGAGLAAATCDGAAAGRPPAAAAAAAAARAAAAEAPAAAAAAAAAPGAGAATGLSVCCCSGTAIGAGGWAGAAGALYGMKGGGAATGAGGATCGWYAAAAERQGERGVSLGALYRKHTRPRLQRLACFPSPQGKCTRRKTVAGYLTVPKVNLTARKHLRGHKPNQYSRTYLVAWWPAPAPGTPPPPPAPPPLPCAAAGRRPPPAWAPPPPLVRVQGQGPARARARALQGAMMQWAAGARLQGVRPAGAGGPERAWGPGPALVTGLVVWEWVREMGPRRAWQL